MSTPRAPKPDSVLQAPNEAAHKVRPAEAGAAVAKNSAPEAALATSPVLGALGGAAAAVVFQAPPDAAILAAMDEALAQAAAAAAMGEVPVGAVVLFEGRIVARAHNRREVDHDPLAHAELLALRQASQILGRWRLAGCTLIVTLEPCPMCAGAIVNSRIDRVVFGAWDARAGAVGSLCNIVTDARLNHRAEVTAGVRSEAARALLQRFFAARRRGRQQSGL